MCPSAPRVCSEAGGQKPVLSLSLDCIQTEVAIQKRSIWVKIVEFLACMTLNFEGLPRKTMGHLFDDPSSFVHYFAGICNSNWSYSPETLNSGQNRRFCLPMWPWHFTDNNKAPLLWPLSFVHYSVAICEFNWIYCPEMPNSGQNHNFLACVTFKFDG